MTVVVFWTVRIVHYAMLRCLVMRGNDENGFAGFEQTCF